MNKLQELFDLGIDFGYKSKKNNLNGQQSWLNVKRIMNSDKICEWDISRRLDKKSSSDINEIYCYIHDELEMHGEEGDEPKYDITHDDWERAHFVLQTIRIPKTSDCSLLKILQLGLNIGQYRAMNEKTQYDPKVNNFIKKNKLDQISSYIHCILPSDLIDKAIIDMNKQIELLDEQVGGNIYYHKYMKYKEKYLSLQNKVFRVGS